MMLTSETVQRAATEYGVTLDVQQSTQVVDFIEFLLLWNQKVNLTAIRDPIELLHRHVLESMFAAKVAPLDRGRLADVGSGGGFPGIPLKILQPELEVSLVEANTKKATFLAEVTRELKLSGVRVHFSRYEELGEQLAPLDFACSRALGDFDRFLSWSASAAVGAAKTVLWLGGRDLDSVLKIGPWIWREPVLVPNSLRRFILVGDLPGQPQR